MKRSLLLLCMLLALIMPTNALAHITNEQNLYEDLQYSEAKAQIVYLSGLGVIAADHGTALFSPKEKLTRADLAYWAGSFFKLAGKEAKHEEIAQAAVDPTEWEGRTIEESWMVSSDGSQEKQLQLIQFTKSTEQAQQAASQPADNDHANHANHGQTDPAVQEEGAGFPFVPVILVVLLVGIVGALLFGRKKK
ncbi:hypothetical protein ABHN11_15985 [Brevibacillus centrosporus]|uniref:hypothetical protein n=1 Tax=Brevibacillus centrosporus TaxID=54910 RepID=UPI003D1AFFA9